MNDASFYRPSEDRPFAYATGEDHLWSVHFWGEHPLDDDDTCWTGDVFETEAEARAFYNAEVTEYSTRWVILQGPWDEDTKSAVWEERRNPDYIASSDDSECSEHAMQMGMAFGCDGYNEAMGWDVEIPE